MLPTSNLQRATQVFRLFLMMLRFPHEKEKRKLFSCDQDEKEDVSVIV